MPLDQLSSRPVPRKSDAKIVGYDDYIESKIQSTRRAVKLVDLATSLVTLAAGGLAYLLVAAIAEHWLVPGGFSVAARIVLFATLVAGAGYFAYRRLWPSLMHAINPVYAARTIELGSPSLKNSLINLLLFRQRRSEISDAVYRTLEEQAAQRLTRVPVESAVDRTVLIRLGYVLVAVVAVAGLYKVLSPKDPIVSAERILMPWGDIVPASRVAITGVTPGAVTISRGEFVDVSAEVRGISDAEDVLLRYTTEDGQVVGKAIPMKPAGDGLRFVCRLAEDSGGAQQLGLTRNLSYRLEAGDARSLDYAIRVVEAPTILVERVDYHFPPYTGYLDRSVDGLGDIRAIEGTRVTIHAKANGPIRQADVDFDADGRPDLRMTAAESEAHASYELALREDRQTPQHASYVLRFTNEEGRANHDPVKHSINVDRDNDPEAAILSPSEKVVDVRLNETVAIEVEARDPDFLLSAVRLRGEETGRSVLDELLLKAEHKGRFTARYSFLPSAHGLRSGDVLQYWVEAADNRAPKPNTTTSERKVIRIVSPNPAQQPPPDRVARNDRQQPQQGEKQDGRQQLQQDGSGGAGQNGKADQKQDGGQKSSGEGQEQQKGDKQQGGSKGGDSGSDSGQQQSGGESKSGKEGTSKSGQGSDQKGNESQSGEKGQGGGQSKSNPGQSDNQSPNGEQTGAGAAGSQSSKNTAQPAGDRLDQGNNSSSANGGKQTGENQTKPGANEAPVSSLGDNDGEAFERIQRHMERNGQLKNDKAGRDSGSDQQADATAKQKQDGTQNEGKEEKGKEGEGEQAKQESSIKTDKKDDSVAPSKSGNEKNGAKPSDTGQPSSGEQAKESSKAAGAKTGDENPSQSKETANEKHNQDQSPGGGQTASKGPAGAGDEQKSQGSPNSQPNMKSADKHEQSPSKDGSNQHDPSAGANGKRENDSKGEQGGDKTGGGEEGGGQKSPRQGTGSSGSHDAADKGAGESGEKGKGNTSSDAGRDAKSDDSKGSTGSEAKGEGGKQKDGTGDKPGGTNGGGDATPHNGDDAAGSKNEKQKQVGNDGQKNADKRQGDKETARQGDKQDGKQGPQQGNDEGKRSNDANNNSSQGSTSGGAPSGAAVNPQPSITGSTPEGDAANLEYSRKQTDFVIGKLADQMSRKKVDDRLLKDLGWTPEDLRRFVERWQKRKEAAQRDDPAGEAAKRELDEALRSLGLRPGELKQSAVNKDAMRDLREGYRGPVPLEYQERLRAYNQGVSRARPDGE